MVSNKQKGNSNWEEKFQLEFEKGIKPYMTEEIHDVLKELGQYLSEEASVVLGEQQENTSEATQKSNPSVNEEEYPDDEVEETQDVLEIFREMQLEVLCGKVVTKDIHSKEGTKIVERGERITIDTLERVKIGKCMLQLIANSK